MYKSVEGFIVSAWFIAGFTTILILVYWISPATNGVVWGLSAGGSMFVMWFGAKIESRLPGIITSLAKSLEDQKCN